MKSEWKKEDEYWICQECGEKRAYLKFLTGDNRPEPHDCIRELKESIDDIINYFEKIRSR